jgi:hypothetical protein
MVRLLCERSPSVKTHVVPLDRLATELGSEEAERILDCLHNPTMAETARAHELEREAAERLKGNLGREPRPIGRPSGVERRGGGDRRQAVAAGLTARELHSVERRESVERRSGVDRREQQPLSVA